MALAATVMFKSSTFKDSVFKVVVLPRIVKLPPTNKLPLIPAPPKTTKAPVLVEFEDTPLLILILPDDVISVNEPLAATLGPIAMPSIYPPVRVTFDDVTSPLNIPIILALPANKLPKPAKKASTLSACTYATGVIAPPAVVIVILPPLIIALPVLIFDDTSVVKPAFVAITFASPWA